MARRINVSVPDPLHETIEKAAGEDGTSMSEIVRKGLELYLAIRRYRKDGKQPDLGILDKDHKVEVVVPGIFI